MKTIQFILFLVFITGSSILMINSGRISPHIEKEHNGYWTIIANDQSYPASGYDIPEPVSSFDGSGPEQLAPPAGIIPTRSTGYYSGYGRGINVNRNLSTGNNNSAQNSSTNPLYERIIQTTLQPMDLIISPAEAADYAGTLNTKIQYVTKR